MRNGSACACITAALGIVAWSPSPAAQAPVRAPARRFAAVSAQALRQWDSVTQSMLRSGELRVRQVREDTQIAGRRHRARRSVLPRRARVRRRRQPADGRARASCSRCSATSTPASTSAPNPTLTRGRGARRRSTTLAGARAGPDATSPSWSCCRIDDGAIVPPRVADARRHRQRRHRPVLPRRAIRRRADAVQRSADAERRSAARPACSATARRSASAAAAAASRARDLLRPPAHRDRRHEGRSASGRSTTWTGRSQLGRQPTSPPTPTTTGPTARSTTRTSTPATPTTTTSSGSAGRGLDNNNIRIRSLANPGAPDSGGPAALLQPVPGLLRQRVLRRRRRHGLRRRPAARLHARRPVVEPPLGRDRRRRARADARRDRVHVEPDLPQRVGRAERGVLRHHGHQRRVLLPAGRQRRPAGPTTCCGEDVVKPGGLRSMENPQAYGDPDHYSRRFLGTADNGGVHINSGHREPGVLPRDRRRHEPHVGPGGPGRRRRATASRSRRCSIARSRRCCRPTRRSRWRARRRSRRRAICSAPTATRSAPSRRRGPRSA